MKFNGFSLDTKLVSSLNQLGYIELTPIQEKTIVSALKKNSFIAKSETGSGKTHAYLIPLINNLNKDLNKVQALIIEPTQELCFQTQEFMDQISTLTKDFKAVNTCVSSFELNQKPNYDRPTIMVSTPGKIKELIKNKNLDISSINSIVLDEADMLMEGEQSQDTINIVDYINPHQIMIFTATMKEHQIASLKKLFKINTLFDVNKKNFTSRTVSHHFVDIKHKPLLDSLLTFLNTENPYFTLVFASKKQTIEKLYKGLNNEGIKCALITSDIPLRERKNTLRRINEGEFKLVLCSDLASRGLDFEKVSHVISLDIPQNIDYYYHRSGRTGRNNSHGDSYIFYDDELNIKAKQTLEKKLSFDYLILRNEGLKADKKHSPQPKKKNDKLEAEIKKELSKVRSNKVKPNYKKKMRRAVEKAKKNHKRKIIMENLKPKRKAMAYKD